MNRIYRSIWSIKTGTFVAVSELVKSAGKRSLPGSTGAGADGGFALKTLALSMLLAFGAPALALPTGAVVTAGKAGVVAGAGQMTVTQGSQNVALNWNSFNIGQGEAVTFIQPNANAVALNRVLGSDPSSILGNLTANGKVFLVNPNGILFGKGASVNVGGLAASTLGISDADFMAGKYRFTNANAGNGVVLNQGTINAPGGYVALLGASVGNEGTISARLGTVALAAGNAITLDVAGDGLLNVAVNQGALRALVQNGGLIQAAGGQVLLTTQSAGDLLKTVVNNTGVIEARSIDTRNGGIRLLGDMQSGTVNADGHLDAGAPDGGAGGFVETSAAHVKIADGLRVNTAAARGLAGTWLIDPTDFTVAASGGDMTGAQLSANLGGGNVSILSGSGGSGTAGNVNVNDSVSWSAHTLTLTVQNNITVNAAMHGSGTASLALQYGQGAVAAGNASAFTALAPVDLPSGAHLSGKLGSNGTVVNYTVINSLGAQGSVSGTDLQGMSGGLGGAYALGSNIDARATSTWNAGAGFAPVGNGAVNFTGAFDGLGHVITGMSISRTEANVGLFGVIGAAGLVRNVGLVGGAVAGGSTVYGSNLGVGGLAGRNIGNISNSYNTGTAVVAGAYANGAGLVGNNDGRISNSHASGAVSASQYGLIGGLVGQNKGTISNSYATGNVTSSDGYSGGLVLSNVGGTISDSYATGNVVASSYGGGLASGNSGGGSIINSHATGTVSGNNGTGGLVGSNADVGTSIVNSYATGVVNATGTFVGGLVGISNQSSVSNSYATGHVTGANTVGGLVGYNIGTINNSYAAGLVTGTTRFGAVVGDNYNGTITGAYFNSTVNGATGGIGFAQAGHFTGTTGLTSLQMKTASNFTTFSFTTTPGATGNKWVMVDADGSLNNAGGAAGATYPMLSSEYSTTVGSSHQLQLMAMNLAGSYTMDRDFDAATTANTTDVWTGSTFIPIGLSTNSSHAFTGSLDGALHTISGLNINLPSTTSSVGLFGVATASAKISKVQLVGGSVTGGANNTGALVGLNYGSVSASSSTAAVHGVNQVGGLVGYNSDGTVSTSYAGGAVSGASYVGGLVGYNVGANAISDTYATGAVSGTDGVGGLVGFNYGAIGKSYAKGAVSGSTNTGGLVGTNDVSNGTVSASFWDTATTGKSSSPGGGLGLSTANMKTLANFDSATSANGSVNPAWDVSATWAVYDGHSYPLLQAFLTPLTVTANNASKTYDAAAFSGGNGVAYSNVPNGALLGTLVYGGAAQGAVNVGSYSIAPSGLYSTSQQGYLISYANGTLTVDPAALTVLTVSGTVAANKVYDGSLTAFLNSGVLVGVAGGDVGHISLLQSGLFASKNVGNNIAVTATDSLSGTAAGNYTLTQPTGLTANITAATISAVGGITAANKTYDGGVGATLNTGGATFAGMIGGDTLTVGGASGAFADKNAGVGKTVGVSGITLSGASAGNYVLGSTVAGTTADIAAKALSIVGMTAVGRDYDGGTSAALSGGALSGLVGSETLALTGVSGAFADKDAGIAKAVSVTGAALGDAGSGATAGLAANYTVANPSGLTATIGRKALTVSGITAAGKVYDGSNAASLSGAALSGLVGSETLSLSGQSAVFSNKNVGVGKTVSVSGSTLGNAGSGASAGLAANYSVVDPTGLTADITAKALTVTGMTAGGKVYDGGVGASLSGGALSGLVGSETLTLSGQSGSFADKNAGLGKAVTVTGAVLGDAGSGASAGLAGNYSVANPSGLTADITQKALSVTGLTAGNKVYDGGTGATLSGGALNGLVGSETLALTGLGGTFADKNAALGKAVTVTGAALGDAGSGATAGLAANYTVANPSGLTADIQRAAIGAVGGITAANKTYDGGVGATLNTAGASFGGMVNGDTLSVTGAVGNFADKNAGVGKSVNIGGIVLAGADANNYILSSGVASATADIARKAVTVTGLSASDKVYDGGTGATLSGGVLSGLIGSETLALSGLSGGFVDKNAALAKAVAVVGVLGDAGAGATAGLAANYSFTTPVGLTANITAKALTVSGMTAAGKVYDGGTVASLSGGALSGLVGSETLGIAGGNAHFADKNVGVGKAVGVVGVALADAGSGASAGLAANYSLANPTGLTADITAKALTVTGMTAGGKVYDGGVGASLTGGALSGLVGSETLTLSGQSGSFADKNAGLGKAVTVTGAVLGDAGSGASAGLAGNYSVANPSGLTADITQKALTVTGLTAGNKVYDGGTGATLSGGALNGLVGSETLALTGLGGTFADKNAALGKAVTVTGAALGDAGSGATAGLAANYTVANPIGLTADIQRAAIGAVGGITAANKTYDGSAGATLNTAGASFGGMVNGDTLSVTGAVGNFADKNAGVGKSVNIGGIALAGADANNYTLSSGVASATADIARKAVTVTGLSASDKVYDGGTGAALSGGALSGLVGSETLALTGLGGAFADKNAALGKAVTVTGAALGDAGSGATAGLAANYTVANPSGLTANITAKTLTVSGMTAAGKVYDGGAVASLSGGALSGLVGSETLSLSGQSAVFSNKNVGVGKTVTVSGSTLGNAGSGASAGLAANYSVLDPTGLTADITAKALTVSGMTAGGKVYDGGVGASLTGGALSGLVGSETLTLSGQSGSFADKNAGLGKAVTVTGAVLGDAGSGASAGLAGNYSVANPTGLTADITAKILTVTGITAGNKVYDGGTGATLNGGVLSGLVGSETLALTGLGGAFADKNAALGKAVTVNGAALGDAGSGATAGLAANYTVVNPTGLTADIQRAAIGAVGGITAANKTYDGGVGATLNTAGASFGGMVNGDNLSVTGAVGNFADKNAGIGKTVNIGGIALAGADANNYTLVSGVAGATADIARKALTVDGLTANGKVYDGGTSATLSGGVLNGVVGGETLGFSGQNASFADKNAGLGKAVTVAGVSLVDAGSGATAGLAGNYSVATPTGLTADISRALIGAVTGIVANNKVYDGTLVASLNTDGASFVGKIGADSLALVGASGAFADKNAGVGKTVAIGGIALAGADAGNYILASDVASATADIAAARLNVVATGVNKVYDGATGATVILSDNRVAGDTLTLASGGANFADKNAGAGKAVSVSGIVVGGADAGNYIVNASAATSAAITPRALTVQASGVDRVYDGGVVAGATLSDNRVAGDALTLSSGAASFADKNVGAGKAVSVSGIAVSGADAANYTFNSTAGASASITPAALTITANDAGKSVGQQNPAFSANYSPLQSGDTVASALTGALVLSTPATSASVAGDYGITPSGQQGGNYNITFVDGVLRVNTVAALTNVVNSAIAMTAVTPSLGNMVGPNQLSLTTPGASGGAQGTLTLALNGPAPSSSSSFSTAFPTTAPASDGGANSGASNTASNGGANSNSNSASNSASNSTSNSGSDSGSGVTTTASSSSGSPASGGTTRGGSTPAVRSTGSVVTNMLPGLNLTVIDLGVKLPNNVKKTGE